MLFLTLSEKKGVSLECNGESNGPRNRRKRVRTLVALLRLLTDKYPWESHEPVYLTSYGLNSTTTVLLEGWPQH